MKFTTNVAAAFTVNSDTRITATVPAGAVGSPLTLSKASCPDFKTGGYAVCSSAPTALAIDDGAFDFAGRIGDGEAYYVNRLTPAAYPATLTEISIYWDPSQQFPPGTAIELVAGANSGGGTDIDGTSFATFAATVGPQPGFTRYSLPKSITITAGDFVVGYRVPEAPDGSDPVAVDSSQLAGRSYFSRTGTIFGRKTDSNYMIRAQFFVNCSLPTPSPTPTPNPTATPTRSGTPTPTATPIPSATPTPTPAPSAIPSQPLNISTRLRVETGTNVMIGGFIITGSDPKKVIIRALGPSLQNSGVNNPVADPVLELRGSDGGLISENDNWRDTQESDVEGSTVPPPNDLEAAIVATLAPGAYTAVVTGKNETVGIGLIEAYDLDQAAASQLANISMRGLVLTDLDVLIGGFILGGSADGTRVVIRALGPSLSNAGVADPLASPTLDLRDGNGEALFFNDNWADDPQQAAELIALGIQPQNELECAIVRTVPPGNYTAIVAGANGGIGVGLVEVYNVK